MRDNNIILELDELQANIVIKCLYEFRKNLLTQKIDTEAVDELILMTIDATEKKSPFVKILRRGDAR